MRIDDILACKQSFSFEIFPPKGDMSVAQAAEVAQKLAKNDPDWISVTFSAGGSGNSGNTAHIADILEKQIGVTALAHLTCLGSTKADVDSYIAQLHSSGIENVLALRGDRAPGKKAIDFTYGADLVRYLKDSGLCVGAACYPEGHVECDDFSTSIERLKAKQDAGTDFFVTQLFFDNEYFYRFREACVRSRIKVPIVVGIMPFTSVSQITRMAFTCGASIPSRVIKRLTAAGDDPKVQAQAGVEYACEQLCDLAHNGVDGLHVYTMNKPHVAHVIHDALAECGYLVA